MFSHEIRHLSDTVPGALPYDAEVEYIESTGTQYVDTELGYFTEFEIGAVVPGAVGNNTLGIDQSWKLGRHSAAEPVWRATINGISYATSISCGTYADMSYHGTTFKCNSDTITVPANQYVSGTMVLFSTGVALPSAYPLKLYYCRLFDQNGTLVRDFIPVRVGTEFCMYDRANPTGGDNGDGLYHNKGTGAFLGSPDKIRPKTKFIASRFPGLVLGKIKPVLKHYDIAMRYRIDERKDGAQTSVPVNFPSGTYSALNYTPTWAHHRFLGWTTDVAPDAELDYIDSLPTGTTRTTGGNVFLTGVVPGPNTSFEIKARALNQTMTNIYGISNALAANAECRWGCDETIDGVRTRYFINTNMSEWSKAYAFYNVANSNGNLVNFRYKSADTGIFGYDASSKTVYTKTSANVVVNSKVLPDETTIKQFTGEFKFFGCPANSSTISNTSELYCRPARLYYAKFWENGVLIKHFVPYRKEGVVCLHEKVSDTYIYNNGNGILMGGPEVESTDFVLPEDPVNYHIALISARWQNPTAVTFDATTNGGQMPSGWTAPDYYEGLPFGTLPEPTKSDETFVGWYDGSGNIVTSDTIVTGNNVSLTAVYSAQ